MFKTSKNCTHKTITVPNREQAWEEANKLFPTGYEKDAIASEYAGYDIYSCRESNYLNHICDLGNRLEVITGAYGENVANIWIVCEEIPATEKNLDSIRDVIFQNIYEAGEKCSKALKEKAESATTTEEVRCITDSLQGLTSNIARLEMLRKTDIPVALV